LAWLLIFTGLGRLMGSSKNTTKLKNASLFESIVQGLKTGIKPMQNVENMEPGSLPRARNNNVPPKQNQKNQSESPAPDFLIDVFYKLFDPAQKEGPAIREGSGQLNKLGIESPLSTSVDSVSSRDLSETMDSEGCSKRFTSGPTDIFARTKRSGEEDQENKELQSTSLLPLDPCIKAKGVIPKELNNRLPADNAHLTNLHFLSNGKGPSTKFDQSLVDGTSSYRGNPGEVSLGLSNQNQEKPADGDKVQEVPPDEVIDRTGLDCGLLLKKEEEPFINFDQSLVAGLPAGLEDQGNGSPESVNSMQGRVAEERKVKGSFEEKEKLNSPLGNNPPLNQWKKVTEKIVQSLTAESFRNIPDPEEGGAGFNNLIEHESGKKNSSEKGLIPENIKVGNTQSGQSSLLNIFENLEGEPLEKGKERQTGLPLLVKEVFGDDPMGPLATKDREGSGMTFDLEKGNKEFSQKGDILLVKGSGQTLIPPLDPRDQSLWNLTGIEKFIIDKRNQLDHFPKSFELDFLKDHYFTLKKQTPSSMEISLEPVGLGKLDIELNLTQDRLQGQILVNDSAGKELIERNLPQLLSDLAHEGLQIGGFTVSLKNQGRGQHPVPVRTEFIKPSLAAVGPERTIPIQGNHLIHIII
jgi:hypothetical protein